MRGLLGVPHGNIEDARCRVLRTLGEPGEDAEGVESEDGSRRVTVTGLLRQRDPGAPSGPDRTLGRLRRAVEDRRAALAAAEAALARAKAPGGTSDWGDGA